MFEADKVLLLVSSTLIISYVSGLFYTKTRIPDILWAFGFGIVLGPVLGYFEKAVFLSLAPMMSTVALIIILFEAGLNVDITLLMKTISKSALLSITTILTVIVTVGVLLTVILPGSFTLLQGMLLGAMLGSPCTIACFGVLEGLEKLMSDIGNTRIILMMESVIADPICIISSISLIRMIMMPETSITESLVHILSIFVFSLAIGFVMGLLWAEVLNKLRERPLHYIMTLAVLFPTYIITERIVGEGGGPIAVLIFGLVIANYYYITQKIRIPRDLKIDKQRLREFHEEITFFIKSFFFVFMGLTATISGEYILIGLGILGLIQGLRYAVVTALGGVLQFSRQERVLTRLIFALGLPAFVISQLPSIFDPNRQYFVNPEIYPNIAMPIVLGSVLFASLVGPLIAKRQLM